MKQGLPGKRQMAALWQADAGLARVLMPLLESALDLCPEGEERSKIEAMYALAMERWLAAQKAAKQTVEESRIITPGRRF